MDGGIMGFPEVNGVPQTVAYGRKRSLQLLQNRREKIGNREAEAFLRRRMPPH